MNIATQLNKRLSALASVMLLTGAMMGTAYASPPGLVDVTSQNNFGTTVTKMETAISEHGLMTLKMFNQKTMLNMVGVHAPKQVTLEVFQPKYGKVIYNTNPLGFLAVPLRMTVMQDGSAVKIAYQKPSTVLAPFGLSGLGNKLDPVFKAIAEAAAK